LDFNPHRSRAGFRDFPFHDFERRLRAGDLYGTHLGHNASNQDLGTAVIMPRRAKTRDKMFPSRTRKHLNTESPLMNTDKRRSKTKNQSPAYLCSSAFICVHPRPNRAAASIGMEH